MSANPTSAPDLASPRLKANPHPFSAELRAHAPVCRVRVEVAARRAVGVVVTQVRLMPTGGS